VPNVKLEIMRLTPTPTALALPTVPAMPGLTSLPAMSMAASGGETLFYYTLSQPPPVSPSYTTLTSCVSGMNGALTAQGIPQMTPPIRQNLTPTVSPGLGPVSPTLSSPTTGLVPDIMHLINYGDKDMGLLLSQR